jgi:hypothetical protein
VPLGLASLVDERFKLVGIDMFVLLSIGNSGSPPISEFIQTRVVSGPDFLDKPVVVKLRQSGVDIRAIVFELGCDVRRDIPAFIEEL